MATAAAAIYSILSSSNVTAYVSDRIYPVNLPDEVEYPAIVYSQMSEAELTTKDGPISDGYQFSVDVFAATPALCNQIALVAKRSLSWQSAAVDDLGTVRFRLDDQLDATWNDERELYHKVLEFRARIIG